MAKYESILSQIDELKEEGERLQQEPGGGNDYLAKFVRMPEKEGPVTVRLLPPPPGKKFFCATRTHRLNKKNVHCPRIIDNRNGNKVWVDADKNDPCPICRWYGQLWKDVDALEKEGRKDEAERVKKEARAIKPIERYYYNCIVRSEYNPKTEKTEHNVGPKILSIGKTLHQMIIDAITGNESQQEPSLGDIADPTGKEGRDFKIMKKIKKGEENFPEYGSSKFLDPSPLGEKGQIDEWIDNLYDLQELRALKTTEEIKTELKRYLGLIVDDDNTSFDVNEFRGSPEKPSFENQVQEAIAAKENTPPATVAEPTTKTVSDVVAQATEEVTGAPSDGSEAVVDKDFFSDLHDV